MPAEIRFLVLAQRDHEEAAVWCERQSPGLGIEFLEEVERSLYFAQDHQEMFQEVFSGCRRSLSKRFPYPIYYRNESDVIIVFAVFH